MSTVLIVEDDFAILFVAESTLRIKGYETVAAATRKDALAILRSDQKVDVLFTDINLRGEKCAGLELAERAVKLRPNLGVLYTTGLDVRSPMVAGSEFLPKPLHIEPIDQCGGPSLRGGLGREGLANV
jgi:CheY-like chemotaxis protein